MNNMGHLLKEAGRHEEAEAMIREAAAVGQRIFSPDHPNALRLQTNLAIYLQQLGKLGEAAEVLEDTVERLTRVRGADDAETILRRRAARLTVSRCRRVRPGRARYDDVMPRAVRVLGDDDQRTMTIRSNFARLRQMQGRHDEAEAIFRDLAARGAHARARRSGCGAVYQLLGGRAAQTGRDDAHAEALLADAYERGMKSQPSQSGLYSAAYGICLVQRGRAADALPLLEHAEKALRDAPGFARWMRRRTVVALAQANDQLGRHGQSEAWRHALTAIDAAPAVPTTLPSSQRLSGTTLTTNPDSTRPTSPR